LHEKKINTWKVSRIERTSKKLHSVLKSVKFEMNCIKLFEVYDSLWVLFEGIHWISFQGSKVFYWSKLCESNISAITLHRPVSSCYKFILFTLVNWICRKEDYQFCFLTLLAGLCCLQHINPRWSVLMYYFALQIVFQIN
jgi:hypothetical protein